MLKFKRFGMADQIPESSDSIRSAKPLKHAQKIHFKEPVPLDNGDVLPELTVAYETWGKLSPARDNAVYICHALTGDSHVARHDEQDDPGWWDILVGPGKAVDTDKYFVICANVLGGCRGTTGPGSINPKTGKPYGGDFPLITIGDIAHVQDMLVEKLGVNKLHAVIGGSLGGHMALEWATRYPQRIGSVLLIATSAFITPQALAFDIVGRNAILRDPNFSGGQYYQNHGPADGLAVARMLAHITYLSPEAMINKFSGPAILDDTTEFEKRFPVGSYLVKQGNRFVERFDANSYIALTRAMDQFDLGRTPQDLADSLASTTCRWLVLSFSSDWLFPTYQSRQIVHALTMLGRPVTYVNLESPHGHDAFLLKHDLDRYGGFVKAALDGQHPGLSVAHSEPAPVDGADLPRIDNDTIIELIEPHASVLDLGCGSGELLESLARRGHGHLVGVELDEWELLACARRGLNVVQADLNGGLPLFRDGQFDVAVLSQTLPVVRDVDHVVQEILRVARRGIISFPNFAYEPYRRQLLDAGRAPVPGGLKWYNTPNLRFLSIADFEDYCAQRNIQIHERVALDSQHKHRVNQDPNRNADTAVFVIGKR